MSTQKSNLEKSFLEKLEMAKELIIIEEENKTRKELEKLEVELDHYKNIHKHKHEHRHIPTYTLISTQAHI